MGPLRLIPVDMGEVFVDIGSTRIIVGEVPDQGLPRFKVFSLEMVDETQEEDEMRSVLLTALRDLIPRPKKVWLILGLGKVSVEKRKETLHLSSKRKITVGPRHVEKMHLSLLRRVLGERTYFITSELGSMDLDGIEYFHLPRDRRLTAHMASLSEFIFYLRKEDLSRVNRIFRSLGLRIKGILVRELLMSKACFSPREKDRGAILVDIGFTQSSLILWRQQRLLGAKVFPYGGKDITGAIMKEFGVPFRVAEALKERFINVESLSLDDGKVRVEIQGRQYEVPKVRLSQVVYGCLESILRGIQSHIFTWEICLDDMVIGLTGGICAMDGVVEIAERIFSMPAKMAFCRNQSCISSPTSSPYGLITGAFWQFTEGKISFSKLSWPERIWLVLRDVWELF